MPPSPQARPNPSEFIYQFRIDLQDMPVPVWRRFRILASETFRNLHYAIHDVMGWKQQFNYRFIPDMKNNPDALIANYFHCPEQICFYDYHDKNGWRHQNLFSGGLVLQDEEERKVSALALTVFSPWLPNPPFV